MPSTLSHEKLDKVLTLLTDVGVAVVKAKEDGHFDLEDLKFALPVFSSFLPAVTSLAGIGAEIKDLDWKEWMEIVGLVIGKIDPFMSEKLTAIVKQSLVCVVDAAKLVSVLKA